VDTSSIGVTSIEGASISVVTRDRNSLTSVTRETEIFSASIVVIAINSSSSFTFSRERAARLRVAIISRALHRSERARRFSIYYNTSSSTAEISRFARKVIENAESRVSRAGVWVARIRSITYDTVVVASSSFTIVSAIVYCTFIVVVTVDCRSYTRSSGSIAGLRVARVAIVARYVIKDTFVGRSRSRFAVIIGASVVVVTGNVRCNTFSSRARLRSTVVGVRARYGCEYTRSTNTGIGSTGIVVVTGNVVEDTLSI
jgi:hypothetical protein